MRAFWRRPAKQNEMLTLTYSVEADLSGFSLEEVFALEARLGNLLAPSKAGVVDGNEIGPGEVEVYMLGPDGDRIWELIESEAKRFRLPLARVGIFSEGSERPLRM